MVMDLATILAVLVPNSGAGQIEPPCETAPPLMGIGSLYLSDEGTGEVHAT